jgi:cbb3-type cytochrome oxidase subunit 3
MFKQFTENVSGNQIYLLVSLAIFLMFFIVVSIMLIRSRKDHNDYMSDMPLHDSFVESNNLLS